MARAPAGCSKQSGYQSTLGFGYPGMPPANVIAAIAILGPGHGLLNYRDQPSNNLPLLPFASQHVSVVSSSHHGGAYELLVCHPFVLEICLQLQMCRV